MYDNYIFDLYGTLVDIHTNENKSYLWKKMANLFYSYGAVYSPAECRQAYSQLVAQYERASAHPMAEIQIEHIFRAMLEKKGAVATPDSIFAIGNFFRIISRDYVKLYDGVWDFLLQLKANHKKIFLLSNAQRMFTEPEMRQLCIYDKFDGIYYSSDKGIKKPAPEFCEALLSEYHLERKKSIMIGNDVSCDVGIANACQMDSLYIHSNISPALPKEPVPASFTVLDGDFRKISPLILKKDTNPVK